MDQELFEFPVLIEEKNEVINLFLTKEDMEKATKDEAFLTQLIANETQQEINDVSEVLEDTEENAVNSNNAAKLKVFIWPDKAVLLLLELYREREEDFSTGLKRNNKIWTEIAAKMKEANSLYDVTGQQCASKMSGLKRTFKNIADSNKKSGNHRSSWAFFSVMDSIFGDKASINPPAIATSDGPVNPCKESSSSSTSFMISCSDVKSPQRKKRRVEHVLEELVENIAAEKEENREERRKREARHEEIREENRLARERRHKEQIDVQKSLVSILQQFLK